MAVKQQHDKPTSKKGGKRSSSGSAVGTTSRSLNARSGFGSVACTTSQSLTTSSGSGSAGRAMSQSLTARSGFSGSNELWQSGDGERGSVGASSSLSMTRQSGSGSAAEGTSSLGLRPRSGLQRAAAGEPAEAPSCAAAADSVGDVKEESRPKGSQIPNPWNLFQRRYKNQGLTSTHLSKMYRDQKSKGNMP